MWLWFYESPLPSNIYKREDQKIGICKELGKCLFAKKFSRPFPCCR